MKKLFSAALVLILLVSLASTAFAAGVDIYIDGHKVRTEPDEYLNVGRTDIFYMDVEPEIRGGRVFVPIRVISNYFGAGVEWMNPQVILSLGDTTVTLTVGSTVAQRDDIELLLEAAPYVRNGRTMVPLRFISEAFGCDVEYVSGSVYIVTPPLIIDEAKVVSIQHDSRMTSGGVRRECMTNICITRLYKFILGCKGDEIPEPDYHGYNPNTDIGNHYFRSDVIYFMETEGLNGNIIQQFAFYINFTGDYGEDYPYNQGTDYGYMLMHDVTADEWYKVSAEQNDYRDTMDTMSEYRSIGEFVVIFDNLV